MSLRARKNAAAGNPDSSINPCPKDFDKSTRLIAIETLFQNKIFFLKTNFLFEKKILFEKLFGKSVFLKEKKFLNIKILLMTQKMNPRKKFFLEKNFSLKKIVFEDFV